MDSIRNQQFDQERALYNLRDKQVIDCHFGGPADGESALKEARNVTLKDCDFSARYPLWHVDGFSMENCRMDDLTRAAIWYAENGTICHSLLGGIKALRECRNIRLIDSTILSQEFGWKCGGIHLQGCELTAEYAFLDSWDIRLDRVNMRGKYSFQYIDNLLIDNSYLDTKDAFWHSRNVTVRNSTLKGEYLAWYSQNLTLINCHIIGTQPLCYCKGLRLINCTMEDTDLSFEYSDVEADVTGHIHSVKNPRSGTIIADAIGQVILGDSVMECTARVLTRASIPSPEAL
jgi:hypothetical protein